MVQDPDGREGELIRRLLGAGAGHVLEVGCGSGRLTGELVQPAVRVTALEPHLPSVRSCPGSFPENVRFVSGSGEALPLPDRSVNTVVFTYSLHHQNPFKAMSEASRVLTAGGRILVLEPAGASVVTQLFSLIEDETAAYERAEAAIDRSGLGVLETGAVDMRWVFEHLAELSAYIFDHFGMAPDPEAEAAFRVLIGTHRSDRPLVLGDRVRYWLLQDPPKSP